jgi:MFS family permease
VAARIGAAPGFWTLGAVFLAAMSFTTVPTPLYAEYQARDGFPPWMVTVVFAAYAVGVAAALYLVGHQGDRIGRRPLVAAAVACEAVSAVLFLLFPEVPGLLVARLLSGIGIGALTASATAQLGELHEAWRGRGGLLPAAVATVANLGGLGLGPLVAGLLAVLAPAPLVTPYLVYLALMVLALAAALLVPETVERRHPLPPYRPQRIAVPPESRAEFGAAGVAVFAAFGVFGLFSAVAPSVLAKEFAVTSPLASGAVAFGVLTAGALAQLAVLRTPVRPQLVAAVGASVVGLAALGTAVVAGLLPLFVLGGIVAGAGAGLVFRACLAVAAGLAPADRRGETLAGLFLAGYLGLIVPVLGVGAALAAFPPVPVLVAFDTAVAVLVLVTGILLLRRSGAVAGAA